MLNDELLKLTAEALPRMNNAIDVLFFNLINQASLHTAARSGKNVYVKMFLNNDFKAISQYPIEKISDYSIKNFGIRLIIINDDSRSTVTYMWNVPEVPHFYDNPLLGQVLGNETRDALDRLNERVDKDLFNEEIIKKLKDAAIMGKNKETISIKIGEALLYDTDVLFQNIFNRYGIVVTIEAGLGAKIEYRWGENLSWTESSWRTVK